MSANRFRFRAWCEMCQKFQIIHADDVWMQKGLMTVGCHFHSVYTGCTIMQSTGLEAKGVEIFEGDILRYTIFDYNDNDTQHIGDVRWADAEFMIRQFPDTHSNGDYGVNLGWMVNQDCEAEVIGNIYQNPELLEQK